jgi:hypothetical protein
VVGTDIFHAAVLLWAAGIAHWIGGNVDMGLAANILVGSVPGVLLGSNLAVKAPQNFLRPALGVVLCASSVTLLLKYGTTNVVVPALAVATLAIGSLLIAQLVANRQWRARHPSTARA